MSLSQAEYQSGVTCVIKSCLLREPSGLLSDGIMWKATILPFFPPTTSILPCLFCGWEQKYTNQTRPWHCWFFSLREFGNLESFPLSLGLLW